MTKYFFVESEFLILSHCVVWKLQKYSLTLFWQKFRESNVFTKELIWRNILSVIWERISRLCGKPKNSLSLKKISWNQLFSNFFSKFVTFTKFLPKKFETISATSIHILHYAMHIALYSVEKRMIYHHLKNISWKELLL